MYIVHTGHYLSEALIFASINPKYDNRLCSFMSSERESYKFSTCCLHQIVLDDKTKTI